MSNNILPEETMTDSDFRRKITDKIRKNKQPKGRKTQKK